LAVAILLTIAATACAGTNTAADRPTPAAASRPPAEAATALADTNWGKVPLSRLGFELELPNPAAWQLEDRKGWFSATHAQTSTNLALLSFRAARDARPRDCEAEARLRRPKLPNVDELEDSDLVDRQRLSIPQGFDSELTIVAFASESVGHIEGHALLFGSNVGRCLAAVFSTRTAGDGAQAEIARRLKIGTEGIFPSIRMFLVEDRARLPKE
jgi:hypothetical protein